MNTQQLAHFVETGQRGFWREALLKLELAFEQADQQYAHSALTRRHHMGSWEQIVSPDAQTIQREGKTA